MGCQLFFSECRQGAVTGQVAIADIANSKRPLIWPVARIDFGGCGTPKKVDLLDPKSGLVEPHPPYPLTKTSFLVHFVAKSGPFARFRGCVAPPWLRACL